MSVQSLSGKELTKPANIRGLALSQLCWESSAVAFSAGKAPSASVGWQPPAHPGSEFLTPKESITPFYALG